MAAAPDPLARIAWADSLKRLFEREYREAVEQAHAAGYSYAQIARAAGISRQGARQLLTERKRP